MVKGPEITSTELTKLRVSVWRLLNKTDDWPLIVCDHNTVDRENDILSSDSVRRNMVIEVSLLHHNDSHKWYFLDNHGVDDLVVFRNVDSQGTSPRKYEKSRSDDMILTELSHHPILTILVC